MKQVLLVITSALAGALLTMGTVVVSLLFMMFSTGEEIVRRVGLFGGLFFETHDDGGGATGVTMGVAEPAVLVVVFLLLTGLVLLSRIIYRALRDYRAQLILQRVAG